LPEAEFAYVIRMFPQTSETFIANEILRIERLGLPLKIYSARRPIEDVQHEVVRAVTSPVGYLPDPVWKGLPTIFRSMRRVRARNGRGFRQAIAYTARRSLEDRALDPWKRLLQASVLADRLQADGIKHVHAHFAHTATDLAVVASILTGIPFSFTGHAIDVYTAKRSVLKAKIAAAVFAVSCTSANVSYLREAAAPEDAGKVVLSYHGVDAEKFTWRPEEPAGEMPLILSVGRLVKKKGHADLIYALALLRERGVAFRGLLIGEGPERNTLEEQVRSFGLQDMISLPGAVSQEELVRIYREATVLALPCRILDNGDRDGLPNVLLEAMATGLPVVTTPISGIPEVVRNGENGLLVPERDPAALAGAIELLLQDTQLRQRLGAAARTTIVDEMSIDKMASRLAGLFFAAIGRIGPETEAPAPAVGRPVT
jgi:glycosyltransferase involved in cell wall biosynthesis